MSDTKTVQTAYGETSITVVECDSCGAEVSKKSASRFAMDSDIPNPRFNDAEKQGYACEHCVSEGPISYPERAKERLKILADDGDFVFGVLLWPLTSFVTMGDAQAEWQRGYALASLAAWVWILVVVGIVAVAVL